MLRPLVDLHTHSVASGHAYSTINELAAMARERGLEAVAVTDHGPALSGAPDKQYFSNLGVLPREIAGVRVLTGVEANAVESENGLDLPPQILARLDIVGLGLHPTPGVDPNDSARNTELLVHALADPDVDVLTHPGRSPWAIEIDAVVAALLARRTAFEINDHSFGGIRAHMPDAQERRFIEAALAAGLPVSIASDAHYEGRVGAFEHALALADELGVPEERIVNRDEASVRAYLLARRPRPHMDGAWEE